MSIAGWKWWTSNGKFAFAYNSGSGFSAPTVDDETVYLDCVCSYPDLSISTDLDDEDPLPPEFHMTIVNAVIGQLHLMPGKDQRAAAAFLSMAERDIARAQEKAANDGVGDGIRIGGGIF